MNQHVSNRHEGDLGGQFSPFGKVKQIGVTVVVSPAFAAFSAVQHTAWMLVNLLARFEGVVRRVGVLCPAGVKLCGRVIPLAPRDADFGDALVLGGNAIGVVPVERNAELERTIVVGAERGDRACDFFALGSGWCGGITSMPNHFEGFNLRSQLPFGPYVAACIAAGEVFKAARMQPGTYEAPSSAFYNAWIHSASSKPTLQGPVDVEVNLDATLAGVGAVGSAFVHALWACPHLGGSMALVDNDPKGLESTNLNRYSFFGLSSVGRPKATAAANLGFDASVQWVPHNVAIESFPIVTPRAVSAVDRNSARAAIQFQYPPRIFSGSTSDLRAEVLRCGPPGVGACLRCFNVPERMAPDVELRARLKLASEQELADLARSANISLEEAREWISTGQCGLAGEHLLSLLRRDHGESEFAVAFVSVMAGTLLAAELIKDYLHDAGALSEALQRATFQFFTPLARSNRASPFQRDPNCPMCAVDSVATRLWRDRYHSVK